MSSQITVAFWLALPVYLAIGVALWRRFPTFYLSMSEAGYVGGMIIFAVFWPFWLVFHAVIMTIALLIALLQKLFQHKR